MDTKDIRVNVTIIAGAFIFFSLSIGEPNSTANYTQVVLDQVNIFKEATGKVVDNFIKTEIESSVFEALLQVIAIVFGFSIVSIMFSMDSIVARSEDTLRLAKRTDREFKQAIPKIQDKLDQIQDKLDQLQGKLDQAKGESAGVMHDQKKEITETAIHASAGFSLLPNKLKEYFKNRRERTKKRFRIYVCVT